MSDSSSLPYGGLWTLESRDGNFDNFLQCRGASYVMRCIMGSFSADVEYSHEKIQGTEELVKKTISKFGSREYRMPYPSGTFIPNKTLSGKPETGKLMTSERGYRLDMFMKSDQSELKPIASVHKEMDGDKLKVTLSCGDVVSKEVYKRKE
nr:uncharacterized protein LOC121125405 [Lepeophtheirus salmonis]